MNESEFEQQLRNLPPARISHTVEERIARELTPTAPRAGVIGVAKKSWRERLLPALGWAGAGAAATLAVLYAISLLQPQARAIQENHPELAQKAAILTDGDVIQHEVLEAADEGILESSPQGPARVLRYTSLERRQWTDAAGAVTLVEVPREDIVLLPVSFQ